MIGISTIDYNSSGALIIREATDSEMKSLSARLSRERTLDGGVVLTHSGVSHGDRTLSVMAAITEAEEEALRTIFEDETILQFALPDGFYTGAIERIVTDNGDLSMSVLIKEKIA